MRNSDMNSVPESAYLESERFIATTTYIQQALADVPTKWWNLKPWSTFFMVTGVTIARDLGTMKDFVFAYRLAEIVSPGYGLGEFSDRLIYAKGDAIAIDYSDAANTVIVTDEGYVLRSAIEFELEGDA
jgi:hypothetical protein